MPCPRCGEPVFRVVMPPNRVHLTCTRCQQAWTLTEFGRQLARAGLVSSPTR